MGFDNFLQGFARWASRRLSVLGIEVVEIPRAFTHDDELLIKWCKANNVDFAVTFDKRDFSKLDNAIILPNRFPVQRRRKTGKPKYEKLYVILIRKLKEKGWTPRSR